MVDDRQARPLTPADQRLLTLLLHLQRWPYDVETGQDLELTVATLQREARRIFPEVPPSDWPTDWSTALQSLIRDDLIRDHLARHSAGPATARSGDDLPRYQLTPAGRVPARQAHRRWISAGFGDLLLRAAESDAYAAFCRQSMDMAVGQFSPVDRYQLALVLSAVDGALASCDGTGRLLDLGCGTGGVTAWLARRVDAIAYGVDLAGPAIEGARRRHSSLGEQLRLHVGDLHDLPLPAGAFNVLTAMDVLAFLDDPVGAYQGWLRLLAPDGRLVILGSSKLSSTAASPATGTPGMPPGALPASPAVPVAINSIDLSLLERRLWRRQLTALGDLEESFAEEGNGALHGLLLQEAKRCAHWAETGQSRRWLAVVRPV